MPVDKGEYVTDIYLRPGPRYYPGHDSFGLMVSREC
jgi:hypothetical protein